MDAIFLESSHGLAAITGCKENWGAKKEKQNDKGERSFLWDSTHQQCNLTACTKAGLQEFSCDV